MGRPARTPTCRHGTARHVATAHNNATGGAPEAIAKPLMHWLRLVGLLVAGSDSVPAQPGARSPPHTVRRGRWGYPPDCSAQNPAGCWWSRSIAHGCPAVPSAVQTTVPSAPAPGVPVATAAERTSSSEQAERRGGGPSACRDLHPVAVWWRDAGKVVVAWRRARPKEQLAQQAQRGQPAAHACRPGGLQGRARFAGSSSSDSIDCQLGRDPGLQARTVDAAQLP